LSARSISAADGKVVLLLYATITQTNDPDRVRLERLPDPLFGAVFMYTAIFTSQFVQPVNLAHAHVELSYLAGLHRMTRAEAILHGNCPLFIYVLDSDELMSLRELRFGRLFEARRILDSCGLSIAISAICKLDGGTFT
jgi:hypothetical protein